MKGYMGKLLRVDLTARQITEEALDPQLARDYIGGAGLGIRLAYDEIPPEHRSTGVGSQAADHDRPGDGDGAGQRGPVRGCVQVAAHRHPVRCQLGRVLGQRSQAGRVRWPDPPGRGRGAGLSPYRGRTRRTAGCVAPVGHGCLRRPGRPAGRSRRRQGTRVEHRAGRRTRGAVRVHGQRRRADAGPRRQRRGDGPHETQGDRRPRHGSRRAGRASRLPRIRGGSQQNQRHVTPGRGPARAGHPAGDGQQLAAERHPDQELQPGARKRPCA